ncbi:hypothetical protein K1S35_25805, partial [Klebsiella pneumoniae]|nr:hypothetical protein [Klebsiella pneumoniae]
MKRNLKAIPVLVAGLFTSQLSIAAGSVSADPHAGHDMSAMQMPADENFTEMTSMEPIVTESRTPIPPVTDADRKAAFGNLQGHAIHDSAINYLVLLDQLEWQRSDNTNNFSWSVKEGANKQVISSQADSLIKISRIWADFFPANTSN